MFAVVGALVAACAFAPLAQAKSGPTRRVIPGPGSGIRVSGPYLYKDGSPWIPRGVQIVGLVAPAGSLSGKYVGAHQHFSAAELSAAVTAHADLVRFQVSQFGLDPQDGLYSPAYVQQVQNAVLTARSLGLNVIVSLQAEPPAGKSVRCALPDAGAERAWASLAAMFGGDRHIMFELYNEPAIGWSFLAWRSWLYGGFVPTSNGPCQAVGVQALVDDIRNAGADNVVIIPGASGEGTLAGMPTVTDPASLQNPQLAYGIHYPWLGHGPVNWDRNFGRASGSVPVLITEWQANSTTNCDPNAPVDAQRVLDYMASRQIGMVGFAFDLPGTIVADWSYTPTTYANFACGVAGGGAGQILFDSYAAYGQAGDGARSTPLPAWLVDAPTAVRAAALGSAAVQRVLNSPRAFVTGASAPVLQALGLPEAIPTAKFTDERKLAAAINRNQLPAGTAAVVYDDEASPLTPRAQQLHPTPYFQLAATAAHSHGLMLIASAGVGLASKIVHKTPASAQAATYLRLGLAGAAARNADAYVAQAQSLESDPAAYGAFLRAASLQAAAAHPGIETLSGLSTTNPRGKAQRYRVLSGAAHATPAGVEGYALDDPVRSRACPACRGPYPGLIFRFLTQVGSG